MLTIRIQYMLIYLQEGKQMRKIKIFVLCILSICSSMLLCACGVTPPTNNINVSYGELKDTLMTEDFISCDKISAVRVDEYGSESILINKVDNGISLTSSQDDELKIDYIIENDYEKIYCKDNIRHHKGKDRKGRDRNYIDDSEFDAEEFINETILSYLYELDSFFEDGDDDQLMYSQDTVVDNITTIEFRALIDSDENKELHVIVTIENDEIVKIEFEITKDEDIEEVYVKIEKTNEVVNSPSWFEMNEFKSTMTYEEVKTLVLEEDSFTTWESAELKLPAMYSDEGLEKTIFTNRTENKTYVETNEYKKYFDGTYLYTYLADGTTTKEDISSDEELLAQYTYLNIITEFKSSAYATFFINGPQYHDYYEIAKKYERDETIISYRFNGTTNGVKFDAICSICYDIDDNLDKILCYAKQTNVTNPDQEVLLFEMDLSMEEKGTFYIPDWFDENDFVE